MTKHAIYALKDVGGNIRYIGKARNPERRLAQHLKPDALDQSHKARWTRGNSHMAMEVLEWTDEWEEAEKRWILYGRQQGWDLLNIAAGGIDPNHLHTKKATENRNNSKYRRVIVRLAQVAEEARREGLVDCHKNIRASLEEIRAGGRLVKRKFGTEAFSKWADWLYDQFPEIEEESRRNERRKAKSAA